MEAAQNFMELSKQIVGFIYPNEIEIHWSILIVVYPYITGLVAGAFILASLVKVFNVKELQPTYRLALLTALAFLLIAPLPLQLHLGRPERSYEMFMTPNLTSAMAMFGFVYLWYLMLVLLLEIWFEYRRDMIVWSAESTGIKKHLLKILSLYSTDISEKAVAFDKKTVKIITVIGIPSAFLLHGYVGFIFGSIKANPWWSSVMMPVVFLFSAIVSGIAIVMLLYMIIVPLRGGKIDMKCLDTIAKYLFYILILDFTLEALDQVHRIYVAEEDFEIISLLVNGKLYLTLIIFQVFLGMIVPLVTLGTLQFWRPSERVRKTIYFIVAALVLFGIFWMRWNVVIGGQLFSKSFYGFTSFKIGLIGSEGYLAASFWFVFPLLILAFLLWLLPPWKKQDEAHTPAAG